eukprot:5341649-Ditylum_brightwellii.AAC.1
MKEVQSMYGSLKVAIQLGGEIWWVTDGALDEDIGYFGWAIATYQKILWENRGHVPGHEEYIETLRTEGISNLLLAVFMKHYSIFHEIQINQDQTIHYCDNMGVVSHMKWKEMQSIITPNECIQLDADVQLQIEHIYVEMEWNIRTKHVKRHQDRPKEAAAIFKN